jgi:F-type H+-transporting ATPase subunit delta
MDLREKVMAGIVTNMGADKVMGNFLNLLVEKKRAEILPEIAEEYKIMVDDEKNVSHGSVISAVELSDELQAKVQETLEKLTGKKVELTTSVDPTIIGGIIAKVGDLVLDGSIKAQLAGLKDSIKGRE